MASLQVLSITSPPISSSFSLSSQQSRPLFAVCRRRLLLKSDSSSLFLKISVKKPQYVSLLPRRGPLRIFMNLPTANSEWAAVGKIVKWSQRAIRSFCIAETVACKMTYDFTGTEALLMGILIEGTSPAAKYLRAIGFTLSKVKELSLKFREVKKPWERAYQFKVPLTEHAQKALDSAVEEKIKLGETGEVTTSHMLLGIWAQKGSTGQKILAYLGFDDNKAEELKTSIKEVVMR